MRYSVAMGIDQDDLVFYREQGYLLVPNVLTEMELQAIREELKQLVDGGMTLHNVPASSEYLKTAIESAYQRMEERPKKRNRPLDSMQKLRPLYQQAATN